MYIYRIVFRVDASALLGTGHVMRCITLAKQFQSHGHKVHFISRKLPGHMFDYVRQQGIRQAEMRDSIDNLEQAGEQRSLLAQMSKSYQQDACETIANLMLLKPHLVIVDHYALDIKWEQAIKPYTQLISVIDDLANRPHACSVLIDHNLYENFEKRYDSWLVEPTVKCLGPQFALLREQFSKNSSDRHDKPNDDFNEESALFVFFGGSDADNHTYKTLQKILLNPELQHLKMVVVAGGANPNINMLKELCDAHREVEFHCQVDDMASLMRKCYIAVGAGGVNTLERCAVGLPSVVYCLADNQSELTEAAEKAGIILYARNKEDDVCPYIQRLLVDKELYQDMKTKMSKIVDGKGTNRVYETLNSLLKDAR